MSVFKAVDTLNPYAKSDKVLNINLDSQSDAYILSNLIYEAGTYVFAIWVKTDSNSTVNFKILVTDVSFEATDSWQLFTKRIDADSSNKSVEIKPQININSYFYEGFLSKGTTFTGWSPAPEDIDADISNAQSSADKAQKDANDAQTSANNAQQAASNASSKAENAQSSADTAQTNANDAINKAKKAQEDADDASKLANNAWQGIDHLSQVVVADNTGVKVKEARNSENYGQFRSDGVHVFVANVERAKFGIESHIDKLAVSGYLMSGAHRTETIMETMGSEEKEECTALYWTGDIK